MHIHFGVISHSFKAINHLVVGDLVGGGVEVVKALRSFVVGVVISDVSKDILPDAISGLIPDQ
jgi:hypothetical protein